MQTQRDDDYWDAFYEAKYLEAEKEIEEAWKHAEEECWEKARSQKIQELTSQGKSPDQIQTELDRDEVYDELQETAREIFEENIENFIDPCGCSDPSCPCSGTKRGLC